MQGLRVQFDADSVSRLKQQWNNLIKDLNSKGQINIDFKSFNANVNKIKSDLSNVSKAVQQNASQEEKAQQKVQEAIGKTVAAREKENRLLEERQAKAINKSLDENYVTQQKETNRVNSLGEFTGNFDPSLLNKTNGEIKSYMQNLLGANTQIIGLKKETDGLGKSTVTLTTSVKTSNNEIKQEKLVLDDTTNGIYKQSEAIKESTNSHGGFIDRIKQSVAAVTSFGLITGSVYGTIAKFKEGIETINNLNKSMTNISMITGMSKDDVNGLTTEYSKLAGQLHETTSGIMEASEEFLRAGNSAQETSALLQSSTVMSKLAGQSQKEASESLISIMNSFHLQATDMMSVVDRLVSVDNNAATSTAELGVALQKVAASASASGVSFQDLVAYIGTISSVTRQSADSIGNSLNSIFARYQSVREGKKFDPDNQPLKLGA